MRPRVAVVEADRHLRKQIFWALAEGFEVIEAADGPSALEALGRRPRVALLNPQLPPDEGWEGGLSLVEAGRKLVPELKWVVLAGGAEEEGRLREVFRPDHSLVKPFGAGELSDALGRLVPGAAEAGSEKRTSPRVAASLPVTYRGMDERKASGVGYTRDLARGGASFSTDAPLDPMALLQLFLFLAPAAKPVEAVGEVRWVAPRRGSELFDVGVMFQSAREEDFARMAAQLPTA